MAKIYGGYMGGFSGKLGPAVGYIWNGKWCVRSHQTLVSNPRTPAQMAHRDLFKREVQLAAAMRWAVTTCLTDEARSLGITSYNLFVHLNQHAFSLVDDVFTVDYSTLRLSNGPLAEAVYEAPVWTDDNVLSVRFERGGGKSHDFVRLYAYCPDLETGIMTAPVYRKAKNISAMLPDKFAGHQVHVYGLVYNDEGIWAETTYVGAVACGQGTEAADEDAHSSTLATPGSPYPNSVEEPVLSQSSTPPLSQRKGAAARGGGGV